MLLYDERLKDAFGGVPAPVRQIGGYELDLVKLGYFGWVNWLSLNLSFLRSQLDGANSEG